MFDGKAYGEGIVELVKGYIEREVAPLKAENESLKARIAELEARPAPVKGDPGESIDPEAVNEMISAAVDKAVAELPRPKDGEDGKDAAGIVQALKDSGELVLTLSDGGLIRTGIRDGEKGKDGRDGIDLTSFEAIVLDDDRTIELKFASGDEERVASFRWPTVIDRGVYKIGNEYEPGDGVTWGGSYWIAQAKTNDKPDGPDSGWRLAVKKGRDGKDAK